MKKELREQQINAMIDNLPVLRAKLDLSQEELGEKIGVTRQQIVNYENRRRPLTWTAFLALAFVFCENPESRKMLRMLNISDVMFREKSDRNGNHAIAGGELSPGSLAVDFEMEFHGEVDPGSTKILIQDELIKRGVPNAVVTGLSGFDTNADNYDGCKFRIVWKGDSSAPFYIRITG